MAADSDDDDGWCPRSQIGLEDVMGIPEAPAVVSTSPSDRSVQASLDRDDDLPSLEPGPATSVKEVGKAADVAVTARPSARELPISGGRGADSKAGLDLKAIAANYRAATGRPGAFSSLAAQGSSSSGAGGSGGSTGGYGASAARGSYTGSSVGVGASRGTGYGSRFYGQDGFGFESRPQFAGGGGLEDVMRAAEEDKAQGTSLFQSGQYFAAYQAWKRGIDAFESFEPERLNEEAMRIAVALCCNAAQALLKCPEVNGADTEIAAAMADKALTMDPSNVKALFRRGCAYANAQGWLLARKDFEQVLRLDPQNDAARGELEKMEQHLPPAAPEALARRQEEAAAAALVTVPKDPASALRMAQQEAERFRREILAQADRTGRVAEWCKRFNKIQVMTAEWAKHQLADRESLEDLLVLRGPLFQAMDAQQREDFLGAYDFVQEVKQRHGDEIAELCKS
ncbi:unnamed protein product [Polarella glacialis]|uniref:Uncharacterized protein n=2 Tax=Polarella glacialis TaxID=89957 RepID=A0A813H0S7_POLGL|nr:unnamed protein product [Polarella glacialis]